VLCRLTKKEEREAQEAIRRGDGGRVVHICRGAKKIMQTIGYERLALEWQETQEAAPAERNTSERTAPADARQSEEGTQATRGGMWDPETQEERAQRNKKTRRLENEWIGALRRERLRKEEAKRMRRQWNEMHGRPTTQRERNGGPFEMAEEIRRESEKRRRSFDEIAAKLFPKSRQDEIVRRIVVNRERFEPMAEACFPAARPQERWTFQTASESGVGGLAE
jgi:hypothetical protein